MSDLDAEAAKKAKLEEARKRVEELKKKKNKNKSKKKTVEKDGDQNSKDEEGDATTDEQLSKDDEDLSKEDANISENVNKEEHTNEDDLNEVPVADMEESEPSDNIIEAETHKESENEIEADSAKGNVDEDEVNPAEDTNDKDEEKSIEKTIEQEAVKQVPEATKEVKTQEQVVDKSPNFFGKDTDESDFLLSIEEDKKNDKIASLNKELEESKAENKRLVFVQMDQETTIDELNDEIASLKAQLASVQKELAVSESALNTSSVTQSTPHIQLSNFDISNNSNSGSNMNTYNKQHIDRSMLNKWRDWNIDMTSWRSIGSGPIVEF